VSDKKDMIAQLFPVQVYSINAEIKNFYTLCKRRMQAGYGPKECANVR
jgi:hypothetical protein